MVSQKKPSWGEKKRKKENHTTFLRWRKRFRMKESRSRVKENSLTSQRDSGFKTKLLWGKTLVCSEVSSWIHQVLEVQEEVFTNERWIQNWEDVHGMMTIVDYFPKSALPRCFVPLIPQQFAKNNRFWFINKCIIIFIHLLLRSMFYMASYLLLPLTL